MFCWLVQLSLFYLNVNQCDDCFEKQTIIDSQAKVIKTYEKDLQLAKDKMERALKSFNSESLVVVPFC